MIVYLYPCYSQKTNNCDVVFAKCGDNSGVIYALKDIDSDIAKQILSNDNVYVYFGGHSVLGRLFNFGFSRELLFTDIQHYYWNMNTCLTDITLEECYENYIEIDDAKLKKDIIENDCYMLQLKSYLICESMCITKVDDELGVYNTANNVLSVLECLFSNMDCTTNLCSNSIDDELIYSLSLLETSKTKLDLSYLKSLKNNINSELMNILSSIYFISGKKFNINSPRELNYILRDIGVLNNRVSNTELNNNYNQTGLLLFKYIDRYRKLTVCYEQYVKPLYEQALKTGFGRFKYNACKVPCLTRGHFCFEKSKGICDISCIELGDYIWTEYGFKRVIRADRHKTNNLIKVEFSNGLFVIGTPHHPILINNCVDKHRMHCIERKWCSLEHLFVGERVICNYNYSCLRNELKDYVCDTALFVCDILNNNADDIQTSNNLLRLSGVRFSERISFHKFKSCCELLGLKHWSFCKNKKFNVYDIVFYDLNGLLFLKNSYGCFLHDRINNHIETISQNTDYSEQNEEQLKQEGYFINEYEETIVTDISVINTDDIVYDIEVEDVHQYNANGVINHNTGRLSSMRGGSLFDDGFVNINIQSVPKHKIADVDIRRSFLPDDNCDWCCIDYKSQEMKLVSNIYNLAVLHDVPLNCDIYEYISHLFPVFEHLDLSAQSKRNAVKVVSLGMVYGLTNYGIHYQLHNLGIDDKTIDFRKEFFNVFPELETGQRRTIQYAHAVNGIYTLSGRFRKIDFTDNDKTNFFTRNNRIALNTVIQGTCGDIMRNVINNIETKLYPCYNKYGFSLLNTIHDEINFSVPKDECLRNDIIHSVLDIMTTPLSNRSDLKFGCSVYLGENWSSLERVEIGG